VSDRRNGRIRYRTVAPVIPGVPGSLAAPPITTAGHPLRAAPRPGRGDHHQHPATDSAAIGATDFRRLAGALPRLDGGGLVINVGSAVVMPEVFLKALTVARNLHTGKPGRFTACNVDMRTRVNVVERPTRFSGGRGFHITGHHEIMVPLLACAVVERL